MGIGSSKRCVGVGRWWYGLWLIALCSSGSFFGGVDFGGVTLSTAGGHDDFVAIYDFSGAHRGAGRFGGGALTSAGGGDVFLLQLAPQP